MPLKKWKVILQNPETQTMIIKLTKIPNNKDKSNWKVIYKHTKEVK